MNFKRGVDPKEAMGIGMAGQIIKYLNKADSRKDWTLDDRIGAFKAFHRIAWDADNFPRGISENFKMLSFILDLYPYHILAKGKRNQITQQHVNNCGGYIIHLFLDWKDTYPEIKGLFDRASKTIRLASISPGYKTKLLKYFRDEYVKNLPDEL